MNAWLVFVIGGVGTYLMRASFLAIGSRINLPSGIRRALKYVAPAVFAAIVLPPILGDDGLSGLGSLNPRLLAAGLAGFVAYRTKNITSVLIIGMVTLWLLQAAGF